MKISKIFTNSIQFIIICLLVFISSNTSFAQVSESNFSDDEEDTQETITVKRKVSSISKGYRVQIYSGPDRAEAKAVKVSFMKRFPSVRSYISYEMPYYKIKVGDFRTRDEAKDFNLYLAKTYSTMIVPSLVNNKIPIKHQAPAIPAADTSYNNTSTTNKSSENP